MPANFYGGYQGAGSLLPAGILEAMMAPGRNYASAITEAAANIQKQVEEHQKINDLGKVADSFVKLNPEIVGGKESPEYVRYLGMSARERSKFVEGAMSGQKYKEGLEKGRAEMAHVAAQTAGQLATSAATALQQRGLAGYAKSFGELSRTRAPGVIAPEFQNAEGGFTPEAIHAASLAGNPEAANSPNLDNLITAYRRLAPKPADPYAEMNALNRERTALAAETRANAYSADVESRASKPPVAPKGTIIVETIDAKTNAKVRQTMTEAQFAAYQARNPDEVTVKLQKQLAELKAHKAAGAKEIDWSQFLRGGGIDTSPMWGGKDIDSGIKYLETKLGGTAPLAVPADHAAYLKANPDKRASFEATYGKAAAEAILGK